MARHMTTLQSEFIHSLGIYANLSANHADAVDSILARMGEWGFSAAEVGLEFDVDAPTGTSPVFDDGEWDPIPAIVCPSGPVTAVIYAGPIGNGLSAFLLGPDGRAVPLADGLPTENLDNAVHEVLELMQEAATVASAVADWLEPAARYAAC